jgi:purine-binding chemotaxis protein CheW
MIDPTPVGSDVSRNHSEDLKNRVRFADILVSDVHIRRRQMSPATNLEKKNARAILRVLTLRLGKELYAIDVLNVREIIRPMEISPVPRAAAEFLGVINLRGKIVPVINLRIKLGLDFSGPTERTCIVVVQSETRSGGQQAAGLLVDEVQEVTTLNGTEIEEAPSFGAAIDTRFVRGLTKSKGAVTILLNLDRLLGGTRTESAV